MDINQLIAEITPLYNLYKQKNKTISGVDALKIMWGIGDLLRIYIQQAKIAPHKLYRLIYWKGEGTENIAQKSWITREFQGRCFRIRNIFSTKDQIDKELHSLQSFILFREAMPFFDNIKYKMKGEDKENLLSLLNSTKSPRLIMKEIKNIQKERIGIKNPRTQRLTDLEGEKNVYINLYNSVFKLLREKSEIEINELKDQWVTKDIILHFAKNTYALCQDGLKFSELFHEQEIQNPVWNEYGQMIKKFSAEKNPVLGRRFRKIIAPERIVKLADMLYSLSNSIGNK